MLIALLGLHLVLTVVASAAGRRLGRWVLWVCALAPGATVAWAATQAPRVLHGEAVEQTLAWAPQLDLSLTLRLDAFALLMVTLVSGIGLLVFVYAFFYIEPRPDVGRFAAPLTGFAGAMLGLVLADNLLVLYVFWELTSITSYLLIGFEHEQEGAREAALQALLTTTLGGLAMLGGFVVLAQAAGTYSLSGMLAAPPTGTPATVGVLLVLVGAFTKSAQVPFHAWLPEAMVAPTPVSAYLHAAAMVKAGVYLVARFAPAFAPLPVWRPLVVGVGLASMLWGGGRALFQHDIKRLLAFGTISQLGFLIALFGAGVPEATFAAVVLLLAHAVFKATLFMVAGVVDHATGTRDLRQLSGLWRRLPVTFGVAALAAASMAGIPPLLGFISKEESYKAFLETPPPGFGMFALAGIVAGSVLTFAYSLRFIWGPFAGPVTAKPEVHRPGVGFLASPALLTVATVVLGLAPSVAAPLLDAAGIGLDTGVHPPKLALWHGLTPQLGLTVATVVAGLGVWAAWRPLSGLQQRVGGWPGSQAAYRGGLVGLDRVADQVTGTVQSGSLPVYLGVIVATVLALPGVALLAGVRPPPLPPLASSPVQAVVVVLIVLAALGAARATRRLGAVLFLGAVGYGVAVLFVVQGAPDLALTQLLIETLSLVLFVLVLRRLPDEFRRTTGRRLGRLLTVSLSSGVGLLVFAFALVTRTARTAPPVSDGFLALSYPEAGGHNVVNVILVDFRALDTLGEITVLAVAALGVAALIRARATDEEERVSPEDHAVQQPPLVASPRGAGLDEGADR